jgi:hypothetical protein
VQAIHLVLAGAHVHSHSRRINFAETLQVDAAAGSTDVEYYVHTYQNGLCYEFAFDFLEKNTTGMALMCAVQWVSGQNERELVNSLLSQISFGVPTLKPAVAEKASRTSLPSVVSFDQGPVIVDRSTKIKVSWSTRGADFVQLHYPCVKGLFVSDVSATNMRCGPLVDHNYPPNGSTELRLGNFNPSPVPFALSIEPFSGGVGYPKQSKTITLPIGPKRMQRRQIH